jgi:RNA polymerase sigma-70 factor (ECF subfamily)
MQETQDLFFFCRKQLIEKDVANKWRGRVTPIDYDVLAKELLKHYNFVEPEKHPVVLENFIIDFPLVYQFPTNGLCQSQLLHYLEKVASQRFYNLPCSISLKDIEQEAMLKIIRKLESFRYKSRFSTWCTTILIRTAIELIRKEKKRQNHEAYSLDSPISHDGNETTMYSMIAGDSLDPEKEYLRKELSRLISASLDKSKNSLRDRYIIDQRLEGVSGEQLAMELGVSRGTVDLVMNRLRKRLKAMDQ